MEKPNIKPVEAKTLINTEDQKTAKLVGFSFDATGNKYDKEGMLSPGYEQVNRQHSDKWLSIQTTGEDVPRVLHVEAKNGEENLALEDVKKVKDKYDNVKVIDTSDN
ncbi:hypothetical protein [Staphylococcus massiliensis]|uniref:hypothetical protein n=1 Tax=Staphylococcus massiliensis TaxID=555791 RepID=UPI001EDFEFC1|nr:hypothetical protein [Staphylococcus massiliensis]MCG3400730.1 hypothetical protein [Staphylococcus massiliensis]